MKFLKLLTCIFFCLNSVVSSSQTDLKIGERWIYGNSFTYLKKMTNSSVTNQYHEWTLNVNIATNLTPSLYAGISTLFVRRNWRNLDDEKMKTKFQMVNAFFQYDFLPQKKSRLFLESSIGIGTNLNFNIFSPSEPIRNNRYYLGVGAGYDFPIYKDMVYLDLSFVSYNILNKGGDEKPFNQYVIGINVDIINVGKEK